MSTQTIISDFKKTLEQKYGPHFFWQQKNNEIILMTEKLAKELRELINSPDYKITSLENNDKLGNLYQPISTINLFNYPQSEEIKRIQGGNAILDTNNSIPTMTNEISPEDLIRGYQPDPKSNWMIIIVLHDYDNLVPKAIGWTNQIDKLKPIVSTPKPKLISLDTAIKKFENTPYRRGGKSVNGIDCSAFTQIIIYQTTGIRLPRQSAWQADITQKIEQKKAKPGDLVFFDDTKNGKIDHVALIYQISDTEITTIESTQLDNKVVFRKYPQNNYLDTRSVTQ